MPDSILLVALALTAIAGAVHPHFTRWRRSRQLEPTPTRPRLGIDREAGR